MPLVTPNLVTPFEELIQLLDLETIEHNQFRGHHPPARERQLFGGQIIAQSLIAAARTVADDYLLHSLHAYFLRPGGWRVLAVFEVELIRDGRSFCTRRVVVIQQGAAIFNMDVSFHKREQGLTHQLRELSGYSPPDEQAMVDGLKQRPFLSFTENYKAKLEQAPQTPEQHVWFKANGHAPVSVLLNMALLAYQSDEALLGTARLPHRGSYEHANMRVASLDHSIWFHRPLSVGEWLLYSLDSPSSGHARGYTRGEIYTSEGVLVASCMQEGLMRML